MNIQKLATVEVGRVYKYDVAGLIKMLHEGTKTVQVLEIEQRIDMAPLAKVKSLETGDVFETDSGHLQVDPELLKKKFKGLIKYWKRTGKKPQSLKMISEDFSQRKLSYFTKEVVNPYFIVLDSRPEYRNLVRAINSCGILDTYHINWFPEMKHLEDEVQKQKLKRESEEYEDLFFEHSMRSMERSMDQWERDMAEEWA